MEVARCKSGVGVGEQRTFRQAGFSDKERRIWNGENEKDNDSYQPHVWTVAAALKLEL